MFTASRMIVRTAKFLAVAIFVAGATAAAQQTPVKAPDAPPIHNARDPILWIQVEKPILLLSDKPENPTSTKISVTPLNFPPDAQLTYRWQQVQDVLSPVAAQMNKGNLIQFSPTDSAGTVASFPDWGVYEIKLTVADAKTKVSVSRNTWVRVWDYRSPIVVNGKPDPLCAAPGINPPTSVRALSPDPGPFHHPRLYCTDLDWPEINKRTSKGLIASLGLKNLQEGLANKERGLDSPASEFGMLSARLQAYADTRYLGTPPDLTMGAKPEMKEGKPDWGQAKNKLKEFYGQLRDACFVAWVKVDPSLPHDRVAPADQTRFRKLAKVVAAVSRVHLQNCWDKASGKFNPDYPLYINSLDKIGENLQEFQQLALAYDFVASWMTPEQQGETRNFLFAIGAGRATGARWFVPELNGVTLNRGVERGTQQNGDFLNIEEEKVLAALCIAGEESGVNPKVGQTFTNPPKPKDYKKSGKVFPFDWVRYTDFDGGRDHASSKPYPEGGNWPNARKVEVDNLQRAIWWNDDWYVSPWGFELNREAYYGFSAWGLWPSAVAYARHGAFNQYVAANYYHTAIHHLYSYYPGALTQKTEHLKTNVYMWDHHDGGLDYRHVHALLMKYMYPDDPLVDYVYVPYAVSMERRLTAPFLTALFGLDPGINGQPTLLPEMAKTKALPLTKLDPQIGVVLVRSGWQENDALLYFDNGWYPTGHMHAEKNSFAFFALGRPWANSPGYHQKLANFYSTVMIQDPEYAKDPITEGYVGQSESFPPAGSKYPRAHPTPPGRLIEVTEAPNQLYTLMAGDAKIAYDFSYSGDKGNKQITPPWTRDQLMYPGLLEDLLKRLPDNLNRDFLTKPKMSVGWDEKINPGYNPVQYAFRTILFVRGAHPYALVVDDIKKEDKPRNYRWMMNCAYTFGAPDGRFADEAGKAVQASMIMTPGSTPTQATLLHLPDQGDQPGLPRLLVKDVSERDNQNQPPMTLNTQKIDNTLTNRLFIDRNNVVEPHYNVLLYPYRTGETLPVTTWDKAAGAVKIDLGDGTIDTIVFDRTNPDHRTRLSFTRPGQGK